MFNILVGKFFLKHITVGLIFLILSVLVTIHTCTYITISDVLRLAEAGFYLHMNVRVKEIV